MYIIKKRKFIKYLLTFLSMSSKHSLKVNSSFTNIGLSPIVEISEKARLLAPEFERKTGKPFIYFQRGEVGFDMPDYIKKAISEALAKGLTKYPKSGGEPFFKNAVLKHLYELGIKNINADNILCTYGGQEGLELAFNLFEGGKALGFDPVWSCMLENVLPYSKFDIDLIPFKEENGHLEVDFEKFEKRLSDSNILYLNNPHNPTGKIFSFDELKRINDLCIKNDVLIVSDEAYGDIIFDNNKHVSMLEFEGDHIISVYTFSKTFAATGLRIGYLISRNKDYVEKLKRGNYTQTAGVVTSIQYAFSVALENVEERNSWIKGMVSTLQKRRNIIYNEAKRIFGNNIYKPLGAFYFFLNLNPFLESIPVNERDKFILDKFLENGIAVVPGSSFSKDRYQGYIRISYSTVSDDMALEGIKRIEEILKNIN